MFENLKNKNTNRFLDDVPGNVSAQKIREQNAETYEELEKSFKNISSGIAGSITPQQTTAQLNALEDGVYEASSSGNYANGFTVQEGFSVKFLKDGDTWSIFSEVKLPTVIVDQTLNANSNNPIANSAVAEDLENSIKNKDLNYEGNIFNISNIVYDKYIDGSGVIQSQLGRSYGFIDLSNDESEITLYWENKGGNGRRYAFHSESGAVVKFVNAEQKNLITDSYTASSKRLVFTIDVTNQTGIVDKQAIRANYGNELNHADEIYVSKIKDKFIEASKIKASKENQNFVTENGLISKKIITYNLVNPEDCHENSTYNNGVYSASTAYHATGLIPAKKGVTLYATNLNGIENPIRSYRELNSNLEQLRSNSSGSFKEIIPQSDDTAYIVAIYYNSVNYKGLCISETNSGFRKYEVLTSYETKDDISVQKPNSLIDRKFLDQKLSEFDSDNTVNINLRNTDKILYTGSSSIESYYAPPYKSWLNKLQDFLDILIVPYGWTGQGADSIAQKFINDTPTQVASGAKPSEINPTYVFLGQTLNSGTLINQEYDSAWIESNENLLRAAITTTGAKPIIGTAYRTEGRKWMENSLKNLADKWNADFIPIGSYHSSMIRNGKYAGFYGAAHPGIRTNESYVLPLLSYFTQLDRTKQGILIFEARNQDNEVPDLVYKDNFSRAEKFRTIQVGEMSLSDDNYYDRLDENYEIKKVNSSQYMAILKNSEVLLSNKVLVEIISPKVRFDSMLINIESSNINQYYVLNNLTKTWDLVSSLSITERKYVEFDKVKILLVGENIIISDINAVVSGGVDKPILRGNKIEAIRSGESVIESLGFDNTTISNWIIRTNERYNQLERFGDVKFVDMPAYLGENKDIYILTDIFARNFTLSKKTLGYKKMRIWVCARLNPKIFNPIEYANWVGSDNPYTNVSWYDKNKYDYEDLNVVLKQNGVQYENQCKSINRIKVGLFWNLSYVDVELPILQPGNFGLHLFRGTNHTDYPLEICDVSLEMI